MLFGYIYLYLMLFSYGYNLLLHGVGSKRQLIEEFRVKKLSKLSHVVVNGYFPSLTMKQVAFCRAPLSLSLPITLFLNLSLFLLIHSLSFSVCLSLSLFVSLRS